MVCPKCGKDNSSVGKYCEFCGRETKFSESAYTKRSMIRPAVFMSAGSKPKPFEQTITRTDRPNTAVQKKASSRKAVAGVCIALAAVVCIIVGVSLLSRNLQTADPSSEHGVVWLVEPMYDEVWSGGFEQGVCGVRLNEKWGVIDKMGREIIKCEYSSCMLLGDTIVVDKGMMQMQCFDLSGKPLNPSQYANRSLGGKKDENWMDKIGKNQKLIKSELEEKLDGKLLSGFGLSKSKKIVRSEHKWPENPKNVKIEKYSEGLALFKDEEKQLWGYEDESGNKVIAAQFTDAKPFSGGFAAVQEVSTTNADGTQKFKWGFIINPLD